jgi:hypothetical protein
MALTGIAVISKRYPLLETRAALSLPFTTSKLLFWWYSNLRINLPLPVLKSTDSCWPLQELRKAKNSNAT